MEGRQFPASENRAANTPPPRKPSPRAPPGPGIAAHAAAESEGPARIRGHRTTQECAPEDRNVRQMRNRRRRQPQRPAHRGQAKQTGGRNETPESGLRMPRQMHATRSETVRGRNRAAAPRQEAGELRKLGQQSRMSERPARTQSYEKIGIFRPSREKGGPYGPKNIRSGQRVRRSRTAGTAHCGMKV